MEPQIEFEPNSNSFVGILLFIELLHFGLIKLYSLTFNFNFEILIQDWSCFFNFFCEMILNKVCKVIKKFGCFSLCISRQGVI